MKISTRTLLRALCVLTALFLSLGALSACQSPQQTDEPTETTGSVTNTAPFDYLTEDLTPYVTLGTYKGLTVTRGSSEMTDEEFEEHVQAMREYYAQPVQITDRAAAEGDICNFDYAGYIDGEQFEGGTAQGATIMLSGNGGFIEGFVETILGKMPGESFDINTTFPEDYHTAEFQGKTAVFKCKLNYIQSTETTLPELNDEFAQLISDFETIDELLADYRSSVEAAKIVQVRNELYTDAWSQVIQNATIIKYPEEQLEYVYQQNVAYYTSMGLAYYGVDYASYLELLDITDEQIRADAQNYVKEDLIFYAIVKAEGITVSDEDYKNDLSHYAELLGMTVEDMQKQYTEEQIRDGMLWDKVQQAVLDWATIVDEK
ncbi:MAG: trigger factor [Clostridia bacterium]|nr:trigger factor [Clostridia bacterium]